MNFELKKLSASGFAQALSKAKHYRYLNQPEEAESICRDVLAAEAGNQGALRMLGLCITDQFSGKATDRYAEAEAAFKQLTDDYERLYYTGILQERRAKAQLHAGHPAHAISIRFEEAMRCFAEAEKLRPKENDDALLRWNRCARLLQSLPEVEHPPEEHFGADDVPHMSGAR
jgi:tetratricopeptide (TPR) repeat protein